MSNKKVCGLTQEMAEASQEREIEKKKARTVLAVC